MIGGVGREVFEIPNTHCGSSLQGSDLPSSEESELSLGHSRPLNLAELFSKDEILSKHQGGTWRH